MAAYLLDWGEVCVMKRTASNDFFEVGRDVSTLTPEQWAERLQLLADYPDRSCTQARVNEYAATIHRWCIDHPEEYVGCPPPKGQLIRHAKPTSVEDIRRLYVRAVEQWKRGEPSYRTLLDAWTSLIKFLLGGNIPIDVEGPEELQDFRCFTGPLLISAVHAGWLKDDIATVLYEVYFVIKSLKLADIQSWFSLQYDLAVALLATELSNVYPTDIRLPFPGFLVELPAGILSISDPNGLIQDVRVLSICESNHHPCPMPSTVLKNLHQPLAKTGMHGRRLAVYLHGDVRKESRAPFDSKILFLTFPLNDETLPLNKVGMPEDLPVDLDGVPLRCRLLGKDAQYLVLKRAVANLIVNFLLYINAPGADVVHANVEKVRRLKKEKKGYKKHKATIDRLMSEPSWIVGSTIRIGSKLREVTGDMLVHGDVPNRRTYQSLVRGFWRRQWYGKKTEEHPYGEYQKPKWIEPYIRGGDIQGAILVHDYVVEK